MLIGCLTMLSARGRDLVARVGGATFRYGLFIDLAQAVSRSGCL